MSEESSSDTGGEGEDGLLSGILSRGWELAKDVVNAIRDSPPDTDTIEDVHDSGGELHESVADDPSSNQKNGNDDAIDDDEEAVLSNDIEESPVVDEFTSAKRSS